MIEIELDGRKVQVPEGSMVMHAADKAGTYIPRQGVRQATLTLPWALISAVAVVTLTALAAPSVKVSVTWGWWSTSGEGPAIRQLAQLRDSWQLRLLPMLMVWPVAYMVASATRRHWRRQSATA